MWLPAVGLFLIGYLLGSVPFGYLAGRLNGIDIRNRGSRNIGATNVLRVIGKPWGFGVFFADASKGFLAVRVAIALSTRVPGMEDHVDSFAILAAAACVIGHSFPVWLGFRGGKGVATSAGAIFGIMPVAALAIFLVWVLVFKTTRYVAIASISAAGALPIVVAAMISFKAIHGTVLFYVSLAMTVLVVWRHRSNMSRLLHGTEPRFTRK